MSGSPSAAVFSSKLYVFHQGYHDNGELWYCTYDGSTWSGDQQVSNVGMSDSPSAVLVTF
jgi:hypothetical protein